MKRLITSLVIIVAILGVGALVYSALEHREQYINAQEEQVKAQLVSEAEEQKKIEAVEAQTVSLSQENERLMAECMKGQEVYNSLTAFNKSRFEAPNCEI